MRMFSDSDRGAGSKNVAWAWGADTQLKTIAPVDAGSDQWGHGPVLRGHEALEREKVLAAVESMQTTCVASIPLLIAESTSDLELDLQGPVYTEKDRQKDGFDGALHGNARHPERVSVWQFKGNACPNPAPRKFVQ